MSDLKLAPVLKFTEADSPDRWALQGMHDLAAAVTRDHYGHGDFTDPLEVLAHGLARTEYYDKQAFVAVAGASPQNPSSVLGWLEIDMPKADNTHLAYVTLYASIKESPARTKEILDCLLSQATQVATDHKRTVLHCWEDLKTEPAPDSPTRLPAPSGFGAVDTENLMVKMLLCHGWKFEQAERYSVLDLPADPVLLSSLEADAAAHAGDEYDLVVWTNSTPAQWVQDRCALQQAMSTDLPMGDLEVSQTNYDPTRLAHMEHSIADNGRGYLLVAARHLATQKLVGFSRVEYPWDKPRACFQEETLVLTEHRGHRLGMWVKARLITELASLRPQATRLHTWNAGENDHMLSINDALGFTQRSLSSAWQKKLTL